MTHYQVNCRGVTTGCGLDPDSKLTESLSILDAFKTEYRELQAKAVRPAKVRIIVRIQHCSTARKKFRLTAVAPINVEFFIRCLLQVATKTAFSYCKTFPLQFFLINDLVP
jgi:hypothetical protein